MLSTVWACIRRPRAGKTMQSVGTVYWGGRRKEEDIQEEERKGIGSAARSHGERFFW